MLRSNTLLQKFIPAIFLIIIGVALYANTLNGEFQFDDHSFIVNNYHIKQINNLELLLKAYHPFPPTRMVTFYSFALNYSLNGLNTFGYHLINLIIHILNAILVWLITSLILSTPNIKETFNEKDKFKLPFFAALLFLTHPLQAQAVSYITQRFASLATLFYLSAILSYLKIRFSIEKDQKNYFAGFLFILFSIIGMFTKEIVFTLPLMVIIFEYLLFHNNQFKLHKIDKKYLIGGSVGLAIILLIIPFTIHFSFDRIFRQFKPFESASYPGEMGTTYNYALTQLRVIPTYFRLFILPVNQIFDYHFKFSYSLFEIKTFLGLIFIVTLITTAWKVRKKHTLFALGIFWIFLTLSIESSIITIPHVIFEHRTYLPFLGFCLVTSYFVVTQIRNQTIQKITMILIVIILSTLTVHRNTIWNSEIALWEDNIKKTPYKSRPYHNLAAAYIRKQNYERAIPLLLKSIELDKALKKTDESYINLGVSYEEINETDKSLEYYKKALEINPNSIGALNNLFEIYLNQNKLEEAEKYIRQAIQFDSGYIQIPHNLAKLYIKQNKISNAIKVYEQMLIMFPQDMTTKLSILNLYIQEKQTSKINNLSKQVLQFINNPDTLTQIGSTFAQNNYLSLALNFYEKALKIDSENEETLIEIGKVAANMNNLEQAIFIWKQGQTIYPENPEFAKLINKAQKLINSREK